MYQHLIGMMSGHGGGSHTFADSDAEAFSTAAGLTDPVQQEAVDDLVIALKADSIWAKCYAIYPFVGGSSSAHAVNLKNPGTFDITWGGTVTHNANGITGNGSTGYGDTDYNPSGDSMDAQDNHFSIYCRTNASDTTLDMGCETAAGNRVYLGAGFAGNAYFLNGVSASEISVANADSRGFYIGSRRSNVDAELYKNGSSIGTDTDSNAAATLSSHNVYLCGANNAGTLLVPSSRNLAFASIGTGLSDTEAADFYTAVQAFQTALSRNV